MTGRPTDDELGELLESRASRVSPDTDREAMAGLRAAMRGTPDASGGFAVLPVAISGRGARLPGSIAAVGLVAVLVVAVVGSRLTTPQEGAASAAASAHVPESIPTLAVSGPDSDVVPPEVLPKAWTGADLAAALAARSIVGQVVVVDGALTTRLCNPGGSCVVDIDGLEGVPVVFPHPPQGAPPLTGPGNRTALRVRDDGGLGYLGQLDADARRPLTVDGLVGEDSTAGRALFVGGWLEEWTPDGVVGSCPRTSPASSSCGGAPVWMLSGTAPGVDAYADIRSSIVVTLSDDFVQGSRPPAAESTFLLSSSGGGWQVDGIVAATIAGPDRPSPAPSASSGTPVPVITLPVLGVPLTADELETMLANRALDGRLVVIDGELWLNPRPCGLEPACVFPMIRGLDQIPIDTDTEARVALQHAVPPPGPLVFVAHEGFLRYLGPQPADVDHPITVGRLLDTRIPSLVDPSSQVHQLTDRLQLVSGWLGIGASGPWLSDDRPLANGTPASELGVAVSLMADPPLERVDQAVTQGSFLVRDRSRSPAWVETAGPCDADPDVMCSGGQPAIEIVAILGPDSPLRKPLP